MRETREQCLTITQRLLCQLRFFGELHFTSNSNMNKYINATDSCQKLSHQMIHPLPDDFLSSIVSGEKKLQCCVVSLWTSPSTEDRTSAGAAVKHRTPPAPRVSEGSRARWRGHLCSTPESLEGILIHPDPISLGTGHTPMASFTPFLPKLLVSSSSGCHPKMP